MPDVMSLVDVHEMAKKLKQIVSPARLLELAENGFVPHYSVDGKVMFGPGETKEWIQHNLVVRRPGRHIGNGIVTIVNVANSGKDKHDVPVELSAIAGMLIPMSVESVESVGVPGVYFLCSNRKVVYVGQSVNVLGRVGAHIGNKTFDSIWFVRVPPSDLNFVEGELIRTLRPKYNHDKAGRIVAPSGDSAQCEESIECVAAVRDLIEQETVK